MSKLTITRSDMTSDTTRHTARAWPVPDEPTLWSVTWLPGRALTRNQAITAMTIAEFVISRADQLANMLSPAWNHLANWADELGITPERALMLASPDVRPCLPLVGRDAPNRRRDMEATRERKPELVIVDTLKDKHGRTVKVGYRAGDVEIIVTPHSGHDGRIALDGEQRDRFFRACAEAERLAEATASLDEAEFDPTGLGAIIPASAMNKVERLARDIIGIPDGL